MEIDSLNKLLLVISGFIYWSVQEKHQYKKNRILKG